MRDYVADQFRQYRFGGVGRGEVRRYWQSTDIGWFQDLKLWKGLTSIGMVESQRIIKGQRAIERRYFLSTLPLNAARFAQAVRQHWGIENLLHWSLDVTFGEDQSRARAKYAAQNLATLRRLALNLIRNEKTTRASVKKKRALAAFDPDYLKLLLGI